MAQLIAALFTIVICASGCSHQPAVSNLGDSQLIGKVSAGMPAIDPTNAIYELPVNEGVSHQDVIDSLKSLSEGKNFVNPANFPIGEHMKLRGQDPGGVLEVRAFCNLGLGAEIMLDHPEFIVFAPCRIALYEKRDANQKKRLYLGLDRPTFDLKNIKQPTERAKKAAQELETTLLEIMDKARKGDL
jgi:uncharacterized protein (DUF302 family)